MKETKKLNLIAQTVLLLLVLGALATGCDSPLSDMSDMKNTTAQMAKTTQGMAQTTTDVDQKSADLDSKTTQVLDLTKLVQANAADTFFGLRQGNAAEIRADMLKKMDQATTVEGKIAKATIYFEAFEYMLWTGVQKDDAAFLDGQYLCAIQQFDREVTQYIPTDLSVDPTSKDNKMMNLYALAVTMHMTNELEIDQPVLPNDDASHRAPYHVSMFDLIKSSLRAQRAVYEGQLADGAETDWQQEGGTNQQLFQALVQTRENFLGVMTLAKISNIANSGFLGIPGLIREGKMLLSNWDSGIPNLNIDQINTYDSWIVESNSDRDFLRSIGAGSGIDGNVLKIYSNMNEPGESAQPQNASVGEKSAAHQRTEAGNKIWMDIQNLIKG